MSARTISGLGLAVAGGFLLLAIFAIAAGSALGALAFLLIAGGVGVIAILDAQGAPATPATPDLAIAAPNDRLAEERALRTIAEQRVAELEAQVVQLTPTPERRAYAGAGDRFDYLEIPR